MNIRLSADARIALRKAITNHPNWDDHRKASGLSLATMSRDDYFKVASALKIDVAEIARQADNAPSKPHNDTPRRGPGRPSKVEQARSVFSDDSEDDTRDDIDDEKAQKAIDRLNLRDARRNEILDEKGDKVSKILGMLLDLSSNSVDADKVREIVRDELSTVDFTNGVQKIVLESVDFQREIKGTHHPKFATLLKMACARNADGVVPGIFVPGPAGSGKTFAAKKVAEALELPFHFNGAIGMAHELLGFIDANGEYHRTPFREAYENGGIYLFDEVDGSDNAAILALNAALANGVATFPDGQIERHKDFIVIATANTWGLGANADYVGRAKLDGAFLDRFPGRIFWDYDTELETAISGNPEFARKVQRAREKARAAGLKVLITPRASMAGSAYIAQGFTMQEAAELTYLANLTPEQRRMISE